ncbi:hypothetical protein BJ741DRAFT_603973 [Chytriomyces cf. hyalinus JEL632]|nr:hypothetical protein BJ741DRAFT_603973 [Chytriomyces cf. hyalinus JEL632]
MTGESVKRTKSSTERRAAQNREAQRAFRLRKIQRIKDLETQVATLSAETSTAALEPPPKPADPRPNSDPDLARLQKRVKELEEEAVRLRSVCACGARNTDPPRLNPYPYNPPPHMYQPHYYPPYTHYPHYPYVPYPVGSHHPHVYAPGSMPNLGQFPMQPVAHAHQHDHHHHHHHQQPARENSERLDNRGSPNSPDTQALDDPLAAMNSLCEAASSSSTNEWVDYDHTHAGQTTGSSGCRFENVLLYRDAICKLDSFLPTTAGSSDSKKLVYQLFELFSRQSICTDPKELHRLMLLMLKLKTSALNCCASDAERHRVLELLDECLVKNANQVRFSVPVPKPLEDSSENAVLSSSVLPTTLVEETNAMINERRDILFSQLLSLESLKQPEHHDAAEEALNEMIDLFVEYVNVKDGGVDQSKMLRMMDLNTRLLNMCDEEDRKQFHAYQDEGRKKFKPVLDAVLDAVV